MPNKNKKDKEKISLTYKIERISKETNVCIRCGKERVFSKSWEETITNFMGTSTITHIEMVCPDKTCQEKVQRQLDEEMNRKKELEKNKLERAELRKQNRVKILA